MLTHRGFSFWFSSEFILGLHFVFLCMPATCVQWILQDMLMQTRSLIVLAVLQNDPGLLCVACFGFDWSFCLWRGRSGPASFSFAACLSLSALPRSLSLSGVASCYHLYAKQKGSPPRWTQRVCVPMCGGWGHTGEAPLARGTKMVPMCGGPLP